MEHAKCETAFRLLRRDAVFGIQIGQEFFGEISGRIRRQSTITVRENSAQSIYHSMQSRFNGRFLSNSLSLGAAYTWSKNLSNVGFNSANINNPTDMWQQYGQTPYSRPHRFVVSYQYELPFKAGGAIGKVVEGWSASGLTVFQSGNPVTFFDNRGVDTPRSPRSFMSAKSRPKARLV